VVLADTHLRGGLDRLPVPLRDALEQADVLLHAGDVTSAQAFDELRGLAPVHAVLGNNDRELVGKLAPSLQVELAGVRVAMLHDSGPRQGREARMGRLFPGAQVVVFGHSHVPVDELGASGQHLFNPGSPTQRRRHPHRTFGVLHLSEGIVVSHAIVRADMPTPDDADAGPRAGS
jgi:putative phosphoesterase